MSDSKPQATKLSSSLSELFKNKKVLMIAIPLLLFFCCAISIVGLFAIAYLVPSEFKLASHESNTWSVEVPTETIRFDCVGITELEVNEESISYEEVQNACGKEGFQVDLVDGENAFNFVAHDSTNDTTIELSLTINFDKSVYDAKLAEEAEQKNQVEEELTQEVDAENKAEETNEKDVTPQEPQFKPYINANDFKDQSINSIKSKYGELSYIYENTYPVSTLFGYETKDYIVEGNYYSNDPIVHGATLFLQGEQCDVSSFNEEKALSILKYVQLDDLEDKDWQEKTSYFKQYRLEDVNGWNDIAITCTDQKVFKISFYTTSN